MAVSLDLVLPLLLTGAGTGLTCGISCGACGNPMVNVFLASYLLSHSGKCKQSLTSFLGFHLGKSCSVMALCGLISVLGSSIVDKDGNLFGIDMQTLVFAVMLVFVLGLIIKWFWNNEKEKTCSGACHKNKKSSERFCYMLLYGMLSGLSPCASLVMILGYAAALSTVEAILVGAAFSLANSVVPLLILVALTGVLSREMFQEIPDKIKYFQLATYLVFAVALICQLFR